MWRRLARSEPCYDNLRLIAVSNINDNEKALRRWWHKKYRVPPKQINEYTFEELLIENFEDYYSSKPKEIESLFASIGRDREPEWDGEISAAQTEEIERRLSGFHKTVNVERYINRSDAEMSDEEAELIMSRLGRDLPGSSLTYEQKPKDDLEFEEDFLGG